MFISSFGRYVLSSQNLFLLVGAKYIAQADTQTNSQTVRHTFAFCGRYANTHFPQLSKQTENMFLEILNFKTISILSPY